MSTLKVVNLEHPTPDPYAVMPNIELNSDGSVSIPGLVVPTGPQGAQGAQGPQGAQGAQGPQGTAGAQGSFADAQTVDAKSDAYTVQSGDAGKILTMTGSNDFTVTDGTGFSVGQRVDIINIGTGDVNVIEGSGATVNATPGFKLRDQWSAATIVCRAADTYVVVGDLEA